MLVLCAAPCARAAGAEASFRGRGLAEALRSLQNAELQFLYSSELLPDERRINREPVARDRIGIASELLASSGLAIRHLGGPVYAIVRRDQPGLAVRNTLLHESPSVLEEIVVTASHYALTQSTPESLQRVDGAALERQPGAAQDTLRALQHLPGFAHDGISATAHVRGGGTGDTQLLLDGFTLRQIYHIPGYQSPFSILDESLIRRLDVYSGGVATRYDNCAGAVLDAETIDARDEPRHAVGINVFNAFAHAGGLAAGGRLDWLVSARRGLLDPLLASIEADFGRPRYADAYLRLTARPRAGLELTANLLWAADEFRLRQDDESALLNGRTRYLWSRARADLGAERLLSVWLGQTQLRSARQSEIAKSNLVAGALDDWRAVTILDGRMRLDWRWNEHAATQAGLDWTRTRARIRYASRVELAPAVALLMQRPPSVAVSVTDAPSINRASAFADYRWRLTHRLTAEIGLRLEHRPGSELPWAADPRAGLRFAAGVRTQLRAYWGRAHQSDDGVEWPLEGGTARTTAVTAANTVVLALDRTLSARATLRIEAYRRRIAHPPLRFENLLHSINPAPELAPDRTPVATLAATLTGAELVLDLQHDPWRLWTTLDIARALDVAPGGDVPRSWDQRYAWNTRVDYHHGAWQLSSSLELHDGWPTTALLTQPDGSLALGARNAARLPAYAIVSLRAEYRRPLHVGALTVSLDVHNLVDRANVHGSELDVLNDAGGQPRLVPVSMRALPALASAGVKWEF